MVCRIGLKQLIHIITMVLQQKQDLKHDCVVSVMLLSTYKHKASLLHVPFPSFYLIPTPNVKNTNRYLNR